VSERIGAACSEPHGGHNQVTRDEITAHVDLPTNALRNGPSRHSRAEWFQMAEREASIECQSPGERRSKRSSRMKKLALSAAAAALLLNSVAFAIAKDQAPGASGTSPGHEMQKHGSKKGHPGASGYAPGHEKR
jgi:hypothetical protein